MKSTGIVRKIDQLGRIVIPRETRRTLDIHEKKDAIEIFVEEESIILQKYKSDGTCLVTGEISSQNIKLADGQLTLSPEGAKQLLEELEQYLERV
jgi:transcriptional pleiotropic regulator of transition state genes